jgi:hypothetical protein
MKDRPLALRPLATTTLQGRADTLGEALRAPASGAPCVHWRLRIFEHVAPGMEFVHEVNSPEPLEIAWRPEPSGPPVRVQVAPDSARIQAIPVLFRHGTPGALAVAAQFGMRGSVRVEEVIIRPGEELEAAGVLSDPATALSRGPFRTIDAPMELLQATLRLENGLSLRPVILPWALGAAAAFLGAMGAATALFHWWDGYKRPATANMPAEIGATKIKRPHWP